jgi:hypothetical protein
VDVSAGINSPAFVGAPTAPTPADTAVDQQIPTARSSRPGPCSSDPCRTPHRCRPPRAAGAGCIRAGTSGRSCGSRPGPSLISPAAQRSTSTRRTPSRARPRLGNETLAGLAHLGQGRVHPIHVGRRTVADHPVPRSTTFHFYATDAFTSTTRPSTPGSANGHCVYAEEGRSPPPRSR